MDVQSTGRYNVRLSVRKQDEREMARTGVAGENGAVGGGHNAVKEKQMRFRTA